MQMECTNNELQQQLPFMLQRMLQTLELSNVPLATQI